MKLEVFVSRETWIYIRWEMLRKATSHEIGDALNSQRRPSQPALRISNHSHVRCILQRNTNVNL